MSIRHCLTMERRNILTFGTVRIKHMISIEDFQKLEIKVGTIIAAEPLSGSEKLLKLTIDFGEEKRQILAGIAKSYPDYQALIGKQVPIVANLEPRKMLGELSEGMVMAASSDEGPVLLHPDRTVPSGSVVR